MKNKIANWLVALTIIISAACLIAPAYSGPIVMEPSYSAGTAALPSIKIIGDEDTGAWSPAANTFAISTGGVEAIRWNSSQQTLYPGGTAALPAVAFASDTNLGFFSPGANLIDFANAGAGEFRFDMGTTSLFVMRSTAGLAWTNGVIGNSTDVRLFRDGSAGLLAQRSGTNAQEFRIYNTDGVTIDEFTSMGFLNNANVFTIQTEQAGGGTVRDFAFMGGNVGVGVTTFGTSAANVLGITADGTVPSTSPAGMIQIFGDDSSLGATNATLAVRTEQAVEAIGTFTASDKLRIWINGVEYHIQLDAV